MYKNHTHEKLLISVEQWDLLNVQLAVRQGANINEITWGMESVLMRAIRCRHSSVAEYLIEQGVDLGYYYEVNKREVTALDIAKERELGSLVKVIEKNLEANERLLSAVRDGNSDQVLDALSNGANINILHKDADCPQVNLLFLSLGERNIDVASILIQGGIDLHFTVADANALNENPQVQQKTVEEAGSKSSGELVDIELEDTDLEEETTEVTSRQQRTATGKTCVIS